MIVKPAGQRMACLPSCFSQAPFYERPRGDPHNSRKYLRIQVRIVNELMEGEGIERPASAAVADETFKKTPTSKRKSAEDQALPGR